MKIRTCNICNTRPVDKTAGISDACFPCYEEGGWENQHQDDDHDELGVELKKDIETATAVQLRKLASAHKVSNTPRLKSAELRAAILAAVDAQVEADKDGCWICHEELNEAKKTPKAKRQSPVIDHQRPSRVGQKINVPLRAPGEIKAAVVINAAPEPEFKSSIRHENGHVFLSLAGKGIEIELAWDGEGRYTYELSSARIDSTVRKVRNVAEALRFIAAL